MADSKKGFNITIEGGDAKIILTYKMITLVNFAVETKSEFVQQHSNDVYVTLLIKGIISAGAGGSVVSKEETRNLAQWSLEDTNAKSYRKVIVECYPGGDMLRKYTLDKAFCIYYRENFSLKNNQGNDGQGSGESSDIGTFELKIAQPIASIDTVEINS